MLRPLPRKTEASCTSLLAHAVLFGGLHERIPATTICTNVRTLTFPHRIRRGWRLLKRFPGRPANLGRHAFRYQLERRIRDPFFYSIQRSFWSAPGPSFCLSPQRPGGVVHSDLRFGNRSGS